VSEPILHLTSPLAEGINQFLAYRRALGRRYDNEAWSLRLLDRYLATHGIECIGDITPPVIEAFLVSRPRPRARSYNLLLGIVRNLFCWMAARQMIDSSPVQARRRRETDIRIPCLFQVDQARRLLFLAEGLPDGRGTRLRGLTYRMVFGVLYGLGLRAGEVLHLCVGDVDRDRRLLVIRETKFRKSRLVPFGPVMAMHLERYLELRRELVPGGHGPALLGHPGRSPVHPSVLGLHRLLAQWTVLLPQLLPLNPWPKGPASFSERDFANAQSENRRRTQSPRRLPAGVVPSGTAPAGGRVHPVAGSGARGHPPFPDAPRRLPDPGARSGPGRRVGSGARPAGHAPERQRSSPGVRELLDALTRPTAGRLAPAMGPSLFLRVKGQSAQP